MRLAEVCIYYQVCVFLSSHRTCVLKLMADSLHKNIAEYAVNEFYNDPILIAQAEAH